MASILQHRPECVDAPFQTEMESTSDDTPSLKRKSISLNADGGADPLQGSAMSRQEKREYRKRLKMDLQQVQGINQKLEALEQQVRSASSEKEVVTSSFPPAALDLTKISRPPPDGHHLSGPGSKEKRTPKANQMYSNSEYFSAKDKMPPPEKVKPKGLVPSKKGSKHELDYRRQKVEASRRKRMGDIMKMCGTVLKKLMIHKHAWVFNEPVDAVKLGLHDYHKVISKPMDLGTIKKKLDAGVYSTAYQFAEDVRLTFWNATQYNPPGHDVFIMANILKQLFEERWKNIKEKLDEEHLKCRAEDEVLADAGAQHSLRDVKQQPLVSVEDQLSLSRKSGTPRGGGGSKKAIKRTMTYEEKSEMGKNLEIVLDRFPGRTEDILQLIKRHNLNAQTDDTIEVDIDTMDNDTLWELHKLVNNHLKIKSKPKKPSQKQQQEPAAEGTKATVAGSGEGAEEDVDVDVDDDDMPTANFPSVVIDKDTDAPNDGSKSSDSSSSTSGSSSSESDSGNSSDSDSEAEGPRNGSKPASKVCVVTEPVSESPEQPDVVNQNGDVSETQAEKSDKLQSERPVSPEKSLRAALLKGRFADTILKAREKNFPLKSDNNVDPEKLRKEREELEKKQKEERARLQAEAKAAEVARKKAEAEALCEIKKKREVEREAARRALQQMERTVDLDAHCEILKDFDLMRSSSMEHFQSSAGEVSPANSPEGGVGAGPFGVANGVGNPLEQLGLFMKLDEEEDEKQGDGEVAYAEGTDENGEVEEGEID